MEFGRVYIVKHVEFNELTFPLSKPSILGSPPTLEATSVSYLSAPVVVFSPLPHVPPFPSSRSARALVLVVVPPAPRVSDSPTPAVSSLSPKPAPVSSLPPSPKPASASGPPRIPSPPSSRRPIIQPLPPVKHHMITHTTIGHINKTVKYDPSAYNTDVHALVEPTCFTHANLCPLWRSAMHNKIDAMMRTNTWMLVPRHSSMHVIGCRKLKRDAEWRITCRRARLVAKDNHQHEGVDYF